jgi:hypothetical protein
LADDAPIRGHQRQTMQNDRPPHDSIVAGG